MVDTKKTLDDLIHSDEVSLSQYEKENYILEPLLPEIDMIKDQAIRSFVRSILLRAGVFWDMPSSLDNRFSPPDEHFPSGIVLHTRRLMRVLGMFIDSYGFEEHDKNMLLAAGLLHDVTKGVEENPDDFKYDIMYPYTIDKLVKFVRLDDQTYGGEDQSTTLYVDEETAMTIMRIIHCHMGPWSPIPETYPTNDLEMALHLADHVCSKLHYIIDGDDLKMERWLLL